MGLLSKLAIFLGFKKEEVNLLVVGLDNSGKSTILNKMKVDDAKTMDIVPTIGFSVEKFQAKNLSCVAFDMSGQGRYRNLWPQYFSECHGIIFVVDSSDKMRMPVAKDEFDMIIHHETMKKRCIPILVFANKMDLRDAVSSVKVSGMMELNEINNKPWHISSSNGLTGEGLEEGIGWLTDQIKSQVNNSRKK